MATTFTRKDFLKGASAGALGAAVLGASGIISLAAEGTTASATEDFVQCADSG